MCLRRICKWQARRLGRSTAASVAQEQPSSFECILSSAGASLHRNAPSVTWEGSTSHICYQVAWHRRHCSNDAILLHMYQESIDSATSSGSDVEHSPAENGSLPRFAAATIEAIRHPVAADMEQMNANLRSLAADRGGPTMEAAAAQIFGAGGKKLRPMIVLLVARATAHLGGLRCVENKSLPWRIGRGSCADP